ncbi:MAG: hypothetical protein ACOCXJ_02890 [Planctomycetota bacterium]
MIALIIYAAFGVVCALIARSKGRTPVGWFFLGVLLSWIGIILVAVLPDLKQQKVKERRLQRENRRLREQMRKDRMVNKRRMQRMEQRIDAHDQVAGIDTVPGRRPEQIGHAEAAAAFDADEDELLDDDDEDFEARPSSRGWQERRR